MSKASEAFLQAAAHIEQHPEQYGFFRHRVPQSIDGKPACILGWVGHFYDAERFGAEHDLGVKLAPIEVFAEEVLHTYPGDLYLRWSRLGPSGSFGQPVGWAYQATAAAAMMRKFAEEIA